MRTRWLIVITATLLLGVLMLLPRISDSERSKWLGGETALAADASVPQGQDQRADISVVASYHNDTSKPIRDMKPQPLVPKAVHENENPKIPNKHKDAPDPVVQSRFSDLTSLMTVNMPSPLLNFNGIGFPGVACNCAPPDTNGEVGATQYVQIVNEGFQVFDKTSGASVLGPVGITTIWSGFNGPCETAGDGDGTGACCAGGQPLDGPAGRARRRPWNCGVAVVVRPC